MTAATQPSPPQPTPGTHLSGEVPATHSHEPIPQNIRAYHVATTDEHHRYRSWEHCYGYFRTRTHQAIAADRDHAALQLAFYLASWGMYRGSSFLLQRAYTVHLGVIDKLTEPSFAVLWEQEFGAGPNDTELLPVVLKAADAVRKAYKPFAPAADSRQPSDTLVTKVLLGTLGCLPACDRYFIAGFKSAGLSFSSLNAKSVARILQFCHDNLATLRVEQARIEKAGGIRYPLMKLVDMYFWQVGYEQYNPEPDPYALCICLEQPRRFRQTPCTSRSQYLMVDGLYRSRLLAVQKGTQHETTLHHRNARCFHRRTVCGRTGGRQTAYRGQVDLGKAHSAGNDGRRNRPAHHGPDL